MDNRLLLRHIDAIYASLTQENFWSEVISTIGKDLGFRSAHISFEALDQSGIKERHTYQIEPVMDHAIREQFHTADIWTKCLVALPRGQFYPTDTILPRNELLASEFYNDFCKKVDLSSAIACMLDADDEMGIRLAFHYSQGQREIGEHKAHLDHLLPHLNRALGFWKFLGRKIIDNQNFSRILDRVGQPIFAVDSELKILHMNKEAGLFFSEDNPFVLRNDRLQLGHESIDSVGKFINRALGENYPRYASKTSSFIVRGVGTDYKLKLEPLKLESLQLGFPREVKAMLVTVTEKYAKKSIDVRLLRADFSLTPKELELVASLVTKDEKLADIATSQHRSIHTVRSHLKSIFKKTGADSQKNLIARLSLYLS